MKTNHEFINELAINVVCHVGLFSSTKTIRDYVLRDQKIPDRLLPGRYLMRLPEQDRARLSSLTSEDFNKVAPWVIKGMMRFCE